MRTARLIIRVGPALIFIIHGYLKLFGGFHNQTVALFLTINLPMPELAAWVVGALELLGGLALLLSILVRPFAVLLAIEIAVAILKVRLPQGFLGGWEFELLLLLVCLGLAIDDHGHALIPRKPQRTVPASRSSLDRA